MRLSQSPIHTLIYNSIYNSICRSAAAGTQNTGNVQMAEYSQNIDSTQLTDTTPKGITLTDSCVKVNFVYLGT